MLFNKGEFKYQTSYSLQDLWRFIYSKKCQNAVFNEKLIKFPDYVLIVNISNFV